MAPAAADYPEKPIRIVVSLAPGSVADTVARAIAKPLSGSLGRPVIIENKPGGDGAIAVEAVRSAPADGYTLLWGQGGPLIGVPLLHKNVTYDPVTDFTPLSLLGRLTTCLFAHPDVPAKTVPELVDYARANPGKLSYATNALGEVVAAAQISKAAGITMVRVPYKGGPQSLLDLTAGRVQLGFNALAAGLPHVQQGRLRMLATLLAAPQCGHTRRSYSGRSGISASDVHCMVRTFWAGAIANDDCRAADARGERCARASGIAYTLRAAFCST